MNILLDDLPEAVEVNGVEYAVNFDFRAGLACILDMESSELTDEEKCILLLRRIYGETIPDDVEVALKLAVKFLDGGKEPPEEENPFADNKRLYSFEKDSALIYAAFQQTHGIDLQKTDLHWWQFLALFQDLGADTAFCNMINLRRRVNSGEATKEERQYALKLGDAFEVIDPLDALTEADNENVTLFELLSSGERL